MEKLSFTLQLSVLVMGLTLAVIPGCKTTTAPQPAECGAGFLPCEDNITECCEVICPELHHHCGDYLTECCLDTTSHDFTWTIDTLGIYGSYLKDEAIIDENNIWVVGNIETDSGRFNLAKWNGDRWDLHLFGVAGVTGDGIHAFSDNDVWVATGIIYHWNNGTWERYHLWDMGVLGTEDGGVTSVWGSSPEDIWFVGSGGSIVHYDGSGFTRLESGTDIPLLNVTGSTDGEHVFAVGWDSHRGYSIILEFREQTWHTLYYTEDVLPGEGNMGAIDEGTDVFQDTAYFSPSSGLWKYNYRTGDSRLESFNYFMDYGGRAINVKAANDITILTNWARVIHFNGASWHVDNTIKNQFGPGNITCKAMDRKSDTIAAVGYVYGGLHAFVARGTR